MRHNSRQSSSSGARKDDDDGGNNKNNDDDAFPYQQLGVLAICRLAEPIAFCSINAYSFVMVQDIKGDRDASFYAGLLISAFAMAEACTAMFWGQLSDRYGRKPIILVALAGTALSSLLFGFAKSYWLALSARVVGGLLNGNIAVMQTMVAEMVHKPEHEPKAYALQPFMWSLGSIAGSALGGFTAQPARFYPRFFSETGIFGRFPYLLPNLVAVTIIVIAMIQAFFLLEETNPAAAAATAATAALLQSRKKAANKVRAAAGAAGAAAAVDETTPLRASEQEQEEEQEGDSRRLQRQQRRRRHSSFLSISSTSNPLPNDPSFDLRRPSLGSISSAAFVVPETIPVDNTSAVVEDEVDDDNDNDEPPSEQPIKAFNKEVIAWTVALVLMCYQQMAFGAVLPIYLLDEPHGRTKPGEGRGGGHLDLVGGLGMTLHDVGTYLAINSCISLFVQGVVFPLYVGKLGVWLTVVTLTLFSPIVHLCTPLISLLPDPSKAVYVIMSLQAFTVIMIYPSLLILLKNATPSPLVLGKVNGLAMSLTSAARTLSPPVVGMVYSTVGSAGAWWSCAVVSIAAAIELLFIPRPQNRNDEILRKASIAVNDEDDD